MQYDKRITGRIIGKLRIEQGMSQEVLSGLAGIGRSNLGKIENGVKSATINTLWKIAKALGLKLSNLISMVEKELIRKC